MSKSKILTCGLFFVSCAHRPSIQNPIADQANAELGDAQTAEGPQSTSVATIETLIPSHGVPFNNAWLKDKKPFEEFASLFKGDQTQKNTSPLSWVKIDSKGWIFHYGNPPAIANSQSETQWFDWRFNAKQNTATMAGPGVYFSKNSYSSASFGWDVFAFPVNLDALQNAQRCVSIGSFFSQQATKLFDLIGAKTLWPRQWSSVYAGDFMASIVAVQKFPERFDAGLVAWAQDFKCLDYSPNTEWELAINSKILASFKAPPAMDHTTLPAIVAGLDLGENLSQGLAGIGGRFIAMTRILTARPTQNSRLPPWSTVVKKLQLDHLVTISAPRVTALNWLSKNPQVLNSFAAYTRKLLPKLSDADVSMSGVGTFAAAWNQHVFKTGLSNDDLLSFVKICLESKCN